MWLIHLHSSIQLQFISSHWLYFHNSWLNLYNLIGFYCHPNEWGMQVFVYQILEAELSGQAEEKRLIDVRFVSTPTEGSVWNIWTFNPIELNFITSDKTLRELPECISKTGWFILKALNRTESVKFDAPSNQKLPEIIQINTQIFVLFCWINVSPCVYSERTPILESLVETIHANIEEFIWKSIDL